MPSGNADRFFVETEGWDENALKIGLAWLVRYATENGYSEAAIAVGVKEQIQRMEPALPKALSDPLRKHGEVRADGLTFKVILDRRMPFEFTEGPILAVWKKDSTLEKIDDLRAPAICVITWIKGELQKWKDAWGPIDLRAGEAVQAREISNPVVRRALEGLTALVNIGTGLSHPSDRSSAVNTFRILKANGEPYDPDEVRAWAASHGWSAEDATELGDVASKVAAGKRLRADRMLRDDVIDLWRAEASEANGGG
jgi:hypothetical protein